MTEREQTISNLRQKALADADKMGTLQRFALFSQPPPLAIGDDSKYKKTLPQRDENKKVITEPRNIQVSALKSGKVNSSFFSVPQFTTIGDKYIDIDRIEKLYELSKKKLITSDQVFKPASSYKTIVGSPYKHLPDTIFKQKNYRDADGRVAIPPRNILTNITVKNLFKQPPYLPDPFERQRELQSQERLHHIELLKEKAPFKPKFVGGRAFTKDRQVYGFEGQIPQKKVHETKLNIFNHDNPFKPSHPTKSGIQGQIGKLYEYKGDPIREVKRINVEKTKDPFKPNNGGNLTRPTPTVALSYLNIRKEMRL